MKNKFAIAAACGALAISLSACGSDDDSSSNGDANGFTLAFGNSTGDKNPFVVAAKKYTEETGVKIEIKTQPQDSYGTTLRTQLQGGNAPDAFVVSPGSGQESALLPMVDAGYVEPLSDAAAALVPKGSESNFQVDGKTYAQPTSITVVGYLWNTAAAEAAGVEPATDFSSLLDSCKSLADDGNSYFNLAGAFPPNAGLMAQSIAATRVYEETPDWSDQRADGKVTFADSDGWKATLQAILDMNDAGCFQDGAAGENVDALVQALAQGPSPAGFAPSGSATEVMNATPGLSLNIQPFPGDSGETPFTLASANYAIAINAKADSKSKKAAEDFLTWLSSPEEAETFVVASGDVPITGVSDNLNPVFDPVKDLLQNQSYVSLPNAAWPNPGVYDALSAGVLGLLVGSADVNSVLESMDRAWDQ
jgi:raffinose/stachyose/melibiose transport system substrate-binding protein